MDIKEMSLDEKLFNIELDLEVNKDTKNEYAKFSYASMNAIQKVLKPLQRKYRVRFKVSEIKEIVIENSKSKWEGSITAINVDNLNEKETLSLVIPEAKLTGGGTGPTQEVGSTITYLTRYLYRTMLNIADNDDLDQATGKVDKEVQKKDKFEKSPEEQKKIDRINSLEPNDKKEVLDGYKGSNGYQHKDAKYLKKHELDKVYDAALVILGNKKIGESSAEMLSEKLFEVLGDDTAEKISEELSNLGKESLRDITSKQAKELCKKYDIKK